MNFMKTRIGCYAATAMVTAICILAMMAFDAFMAGQSGHSVASAGTSNHASHQIGVSTVLHMVTTGLLVGPATLVATLMNRRAYLLNDELRRLVNRDRLTNAATRDFFFNMMEENPTNYGVSLMIDIDHFKRINDTHGHLAGDIVIRRVATTLRKNVRPQDIVARFGGEEFVVFLANHDNDDGYLIAERMRQRIASDVHEINGEKVNVTVSIGGSLKEAIGDIETAINEADQALYQAKQEGRNRTVFQDHASQSHRATTTMPAVV